MCLFFIIFFAYSNFLVAITMPLKFRLSKKTKKVVKALISEKWGWKKATYLVSTTYYGKQGGNYPKVAKFKVT